MKDKAIVLNTLIITLGVVFLLAAIALAIAAHNSGRQETKRQMVEACELAPPEDINNCLLMVSLHG